LKKVKKKENNDIQDKEATRKKQFANFLCQRTDEKTATRRKNEEKRCDNATFIQ
jgi:hypothetical protein